VTLPKKLASSARKSGGRLWFALPDDASDDVIDRAAKKLGGDVRVIAVEMPLGLRGEDMTAATYIAPGRKDEDDLTDVAAETLDAWISEMHGGAFDEDVAARALAWAPVDMLAKAIADVE
jgi:hypothetical protein